MVLVGFAFAAYLPGSKRDRFAPARWMPVAVDVVARLEDSSSSNNSSPLRKPELPACLCWMSDHDLVEASEARRSKAG